MQCKSRVIYASLGGFVYMDKSAWFVLIKVIIGGEAPFPPDWSICGRRCSPSRLFWGPSHLNQHTRMQNDCIKDLCSHPFPVLCNSAGSSLLRPPSAMWLLTANFWCQCWQHNPVLGKACTLCLASLLFLCDILETISRQSHWRIRSMWWRNPVVPVEATLDHLTSCWHWAIWKC